VSALLAPTLAHLERLVAFGTENPPKRIGDSGIIEYVAASLGAGFEVEVTDLGDGSINLFARRGAPRVLWNFHMDTVPAAQGWDGSPFELRVDEDRACAVGLGACDITGAVAAMLAAVHAARGDVALLFSTDEEAGKGRCIEAFLARGLAFDGVVVAEPTKGRAVLAHRGIGTASGVFRGHAGHASRANASDESATHEAVRWAAKALAYVEAAPGPATGDESGVLSGLRVNLGRIEGGEKPNVVAAETRVRFGIRPPPGTDPRDAVATLQALAPRPDRVAWEPGFFGPPLPADAGDDLARRGRALADLLDLPVGPAVDFWTEAALFSERGYPAIVFGPGDIAQAHTKDEWVSLHELTTVATTYERLLTPPN
jgi:acetylornithine deacetylase